MLKRSKLLLRALSCAHNSYLKKRLLIDVNSKGFIIFQKLVHQYEHRNKFCISPVVSCKKVQEIQNLYTSQHNEMKSTKPLCFGVN